MYNVNIVSTGSIGNMVIIDECIMIDIGLTYKKCSHLLEGIDKLLITHRHSDHLNVAAIRQIHKHKPWRLHNMLMTNQDVADKIRDSHNKSFKFEVNSENIFTSDSEFDIIAGGRTYNIKTFPLDHDVENQGFVITNDLGETLIYATDTSTMKFAPRDKYDYIVVEGNYDEDKVIHSMNTGDDAEVFRAIRNFRHLSVQSFEDFVTNNSKPGSVIYQLHESGTYGMSSSLGENNMIRSNDAE